MQFIDLQCGHGQVCRGVDPVGGLRPVGAPHGRHARVPVQVDVQHELADEVKVLQVVLAGLVVGARVALLSWLQMLILDRRLFVLGFGLRLKFSSLVQNELWSLRSSDEIDP